MSGSGQTWTNMAEIVRAGRVSQRGARKDRDTKHCNLGVRRRCDLVTGQLMEQLGYINCCNAEMRGTTFQSVEAECLLLIMTCHVLRVEGLTHLPVW